MRQEDIDEAPVRKSERGEAGRKGETVKTAAESRQTSEERKEMRKDEIVRQKGDSREI